MPGGLIPSGVWLFGTPTRAENGASWEATTWTGSPKGERCGSTRVSRTSPELNIRCLKTSGGRLLSVAAVYDRRITRSGSARASCGGEGALAFANSYCTSQSISTSDRVVGPAIGAEAGPFFKLAADLSMPRAVFNTPSIRRHYPVLRFAQFIRLHPRNPR